jgi:hypothetical protein
VPDQGIHLIAYLRDGSSDIAVEAREDTIGASMIAVPDRPQGACARPLQNLAAERAA